MLIACPSCSRQLKLDDPELVGKQVRCPGCGQAFVAELPEVPLLEVAPAPPLRRARKRADKTGFVVAAMAVLAGCVGVYFVLRSDSRKTDDRERATRARETDSDQDTDDRKQPVDAVAAANQLSGTTKGTDNTRSTPTQPRVATKDGADQPRPVEPFSEKEFDGLKAPLLSGQPPVATAGIPQGLEVELLARWARLAPRDSRGEKLSFPLELILILKGKPAVEAFGYGNLVVDKAQTDGGVALVRTRIGVVNSSFADSMFVPIVHDDQPADRLYVPFSFDAPADRVNEIATFQGSVQLRIPEETVEGTIADIYAEELSNAKLKAAGVRIIKLKRFGFDAAALSVPDPAMIADVEVLQPDGEPHEFAVVEVERFAGARQLVVTLANKPLPGDVKLKIAVHTKLKRIDVPFKFAKLPVPAAKPTAVTLTAKEFLARFDKDPAAADSQFSDVTVTLTGNVKRSDRQEGHLVLAAPGAKHVVNCRFESPPADFPKAGRRITVRGEYEVYFVGELELAECEVVGGQ